MIINDRFIENKIDKNNNLVITYKCEVCKNENVKVIRNNKVTIIKCRCNKKIVIVPCEKGKNGEVLDFFNIAYKDYREILKKNNIILNKDNTYNNYRSLLDILMNTSDNIKK